MRQESESLQKVSRVFFFLLFYNVYPCFHASRYIMYISFVVRELRAGESSLTIDFSSSRGFARARNLLVCTIL